MNFVNFIKSLIAARKATQVYKTYQEAAKRIDDTVNVILADNKVPKLYERNICCSLAISKGLVWGATSNTAIAIDYARELVQANKESRAISSVLHA